MSDRQRKLIAAIQTAGMLPPFLIPRSMDREARTGAKRERMLHAVGHAVDPYRYVLEGLGVDQFAGRPGT